MNDSEFDDLLRSARGEIPLPPSFRSGVWHRIDNGRRRATSRWNPLWEGLLRSRGGVGAVAVMAMLGAWLGAINAPAGEASGKVAYVESISPFTHSPE
jgi:hypothetical protein